MLTKLHLFEQKNCKEFGAQEHSYYQCWKMMPNIKDYFDELKFQKKSIYLKLIFLWFTI